MSNEPKNAPAPGPRIRDKFLEDAIEAGYRDPANVGGIAFEDKGDAIDFADECHKRGWNVAVVIGDALGDASGRRWYVVNNDNGWDQWAPCSQNQQQGNAPALPPEMIRAATEAILQGQGYTAAKWASPVRLAQARQDALAALQAVGVAEMAAEVERLRTECDLWASDRKAADLLAQLAAAQGERDNLREVLKGVEWIQDAPCYCPICFSTEEQGHAPACGLKAALADGQGEGEK